MAKASGVNAELLIDWLDNPIEFIYKHQADLIWNVVFLPDFCQLYLFAMLFGSMVARYMAGGGLVDDMVDFYKIKDLGNGGIMKIWNWGIKPFVRKERE